MLDLLILAFIKWKELCCWLSVGSGWVLVSVDSGGFCWAVQIEDLFEQTFQWMSVQMKYVCRPRVKRDIYWENFIWSLNEANHILDFSKLFSNKELVFIFISPWCFDFIYSSCDMLFVEVSLSFSIQTQLLKSYKGHHTVSDINPIFFKCLSNQARDKLGRGKNPEK